MGTWATYRQNEGQFQFGIGDLDPSQCTHLIYSFAGLSNETWSITSLDPYLDLKENYGTFQILFSELKPLKFHC